MKTPGKSAGFAIVEILVAITILSVALLAIASGVSSGILAISGNKNMSRAMIIAKSRLNEFLLYNTRGTDIQTEPVREYPGFFFTRKISRYEHEVFGPVNARRAEFTVSWDERGSRKSFSLSYLFFER
jgi:type II secretory pathway pseudopilin PulG